MKILIVVLFVFIPTVSQANGYYNSLINGFTGFNVKEFLDINDIQYESENSIYKMEVEKATDGYLYDRISGYYLETLSACKLDNNSINKALFVKGKQMQQLFLENGLACGIKDIINK